MTGILLSEPTVSVVIPTCDRPVEYLIAAIRSVQLQSIAPLEILIVDNGEKAILKEDVLPEVKLYRLKPYVGASRARNFGAAMSKGDYIAFLDDDDWWDEDFLKEACLVAFEGSYRCVYGRKDCWKNGFINRYKMVSQDDLHVPCLLKYNPGFGGQNVLIERQLFFSIGGFDEYLYISEDRALAIDVLLHGERIGLAENAVAILRHHGGNRLRNFKSRKINFIWKYRKYMTASLFARSLIFYATAGVFTAIRHTRSKFSLARLTRA